MAELTDSGTLSRLFPRASVELKVGVERHTHALLPLPVEDSSQVLYGNEWFRLSGTSREVEYGTQYSFRLTNVNQASVRIARLRFPAEGGLGAFLEGTDPRRISFLRNGYQSWSTARSYRISEKPLRPRLKLVSLVSSNMANLPSNTAGMLSSEMYTVVQDLDSRKSWLVGQQPPFDQFFYVILNVDQKGSGSYVELIYDFGRQYIEPGNSIDLDGLVFLTGLRPEVEQSYFMGIKESIDYEPPRKNVRGWCSWYQYYQKITPEILYKNLRVLKERGLGFDFFQIDDGYQSAVGDWLVQKPAFDGRMKELADAVKAAGMKPGIWIAPFAAGRNSQLIRIHPEYVLKDEFGHQLIAGFNPVWKGFYRGLDVTHPRFAEYVRHFIDTIVHEWGYEYLKCDFLFSACLRGAAHHELELSRAQILKRGMRIIREAAGPEATIIGCGMPLSAGIGLVDAMRVGPDTGHFWLQRSAHLLRTGCMVGARNSIRNFMVRTTMHKRLWLNDPDCVMIRDRDTKLGPGEREAQMAAIALSGGLLMYSDDFSVLPDRAFRDLELVDRVSADCFNGRAIAIDLMEQEMPEIYFNTSGYVGFFNFRPRGQARSYDLSILRRYEPELACLEDCRTGERIPVGESLELRLPRHGARLFKIHGGGAGSDRLASGGEE